MMTSSLRRSVRPWFNLLDGPRRESKNGMYFFVSQSDIGALVCNLAHWHKPTRRADVDGTKWTHLAWCRCDHSVAFPATVPIPALVSPLDVEPLTARAAAELRQAQVVFRLHHLL